MRNGIYIRQTIAISKRTPQFANRALIFNQLEMRVLYSDVLSMSDLDFSLRQDKSCLPLILNDLYTALLNVNEQVKRLD